MEQCYHYQSGGHALRDSRIIDPHPHPHPPIQVIPVLHPHPVKPALQMPTQVVSSLQPQVPTSRPTARKFNNTVGPRVSGLVGAIAGCLNFAGYHGQGETAVTRRGPFMNPLPIHIESIRGSHNFTQCRGYIRRWPNDLLGFWLYGHMALH